LGRVFPFGDARSHGNAPALAAGDTVTSISRTASGNGYWLFTARAGRVYRSATRAFYGDMRHTHLNGPVLDSMRTSSGARLLMVASDGGVFSFGDARFHAFDRSHATQRASRDHSWPIPTRGGLAGGGRWLESSRSMRRRGSMGGAHLNRPFVGMVAFGNGYLMVGADGGIFDSRRSRSSDRSELIHRRFRSSRPPPSA